MTGLTELIHRANTSLVEFGFYSTLFLLNFSIAATFRQTNVFSASALLHVRCVFIEQANYPVTFEIHLIYTHL